MTPPIQAVLPDGRRRHFQHGPIDLVIEAFGAASQLALAYDQAWVRFQTVLEELVSELPVLRSPVGGRLEGHVARRMARACAPHGGVFVTPMAAVAGAVADEVLAALLRGREIARAYVNNRGDIALHLAPGESFKTGLVTLGDEPALGVYTRISGASAVRGIATSGWRGRSQSLGIADSVTVLAQTAAAADVAATLIANAVDTRDDAIERVAARHMDADSDLGGRLVTVAVGALSPEAVAVALGRGCDTARSMVDRGLIEGAHLTLKSRSRVVGASKLLEKVA
jgi:ApbE superfamily uncharacterized protein (UPF0280 family)